MAIVKTIIPEVQQIMDDADERELWIVGREFERPPFFHAGKGGDTRLARALRVCTEGRITPNSDGSYTVEGSEGRTYRCADMCSCPQSQQSKSKYCYHYVAVCLYIEWQRRLRTTPTYTTPRASDPDEDHLGNGFPVDDETLPTGSSPVQALPLPPSSVDERLAQAASVAMDAVYTALAPQMPQEDPMPADEYIPEPETDDAPVAVAEAPQATRAPGSRPGQALTPVTPQEDDLERALTLWTAQRQIVQRFLKHQLIAGTDYYQLRLGKVESKPSLSKAGAEKVLSWLKWSASFTPDTGTWEMLGRPTNVVCYVCHLHTRSGEIVGEGRGARSITKDNGDINKAIKMAEKSSMVSAVLRTGALSDCFTQDLEDMQETPTPATTTKAPTSQELRGRIWAIVKEQMPEGASRNDVEAWIKTRTGYDLHPDTYRDILAQLEVR